MEQSCQEAGGNVSSNPGQHAVYSIKCSPGKLSDIWQLEEIWNYDLEDQLIVEAINITSAVTNGVPMLARKAKIVAFQEHPVEGKAAAEFKQQGLEAGWDMVLWDS